MQWRAGTGCRCYSYGEVSGTTTAQDVRAETFRKRGRRTGIWARVCSPGRDVGELQDGKTFLEIRSRLDHAARGVAQC